MNRTLIRGVCYAADATNDRISQEADTARPGAKTPTQLYFVSPEVFTAEQIGIFAKQWVVVGHQNLATRPASYR
jgi:hypothetical protein